MTTTATLVPGTDVKALPASVKGRDLRSRETRVPTSEPNVFLVLSTFHSGDRKQFVSQVMGVRTRSAEESGSIFDSWICSPMDTITVHAAPVARFSAKAADAHHAEAQDRLAYAIECGMDFAPVLAATPED